MPVTRSVGRYTFVTFDAVLGTIGSTARFDAVLHEVKPDTIAVDLPIKGLGDVQRGKAVDPFVNAAVRAVDAVAQEGVLLPYQRALEWARENDAEVKPIARDGELNLFGQWRLRGIAGKLAGAEPQARLDALFRQASKDGRLAKPVTMRTAHLASSLAGVVRSETPRTLAVLTYPWGEVVTSQVRRELGLSRMEGERMVGGWPD